MNLSPTQERLLGDAKMNDGDYQLFYGSAGGWSGNYGWLANTLTRFTLGTKEALVRKGIIERIHPEGEPYWRTTFQITDKYLEFTKDQ